MGSGADHNRGMCPINGLLLGAFCPIAKNVHFLLQLLKVRKCGGPVRIRKQNEPASSAKNSFAYGTALAEVLREFEYKEFGLVSVLFECGVIVSVGERLLLKIRNK